ncbi:erythromycin esterase family protein [Cellulomonas sp. 179-A 4D5 NHS]|uniref:erythromycin esterase family protein n=1 Tax=Cellulomonas sp. 179-A 4D5 NHS TaxID=3142378 RepID=UPI0039A146F2
MRPDPDVRSLARPLRTPADLDPLLERVGDAHHVLLGEASHGTHEFYAWRTALTRRLVEEKGFSIVAVEGDWPDCYRVDRSVELDPAAPEDPAEALRAFDRWPTWMWANEDVVDLTRWLRAHNAGLPPEARVGFFGLDVYSLWDSLRATLEYLQEHEPDHVAPALEAFRCFEPYAEDPQAYALATHLVPTTCEAEVVDVLARLRDLTDGDLGHAERFDAEQNAAVVAGAEAYYRAMIRGGPSSWNVRDRHMADTLDRLVEHRRAANPGTPVKAVVWEHNTHVGDARYTDMARAGMVNVGQLVRERHGEDDVVLVGFGTDRGTVVAADEWGSAPAVVRVPPARDGSVEDLLRSSLDVPAALVVVPADRPRWLTEPTDHRAIGVVYRPEAERWGNYVPTVLGSRYDAFCWFETTSAVVPLHGTRAVGGELETWPAGV